MKKESFSITVKKMKKMKIGFFPAGDISIASSRIRVYSLFPKLKELGINYSVKPSLSELPTLDVIFVQKRITPKILKYVRLAKLLRKTVIYDVDDFGDALWKYWTSQEEFSNILRLADAITVGSESQKKIIERNYPGYKFMVFPCMVDYFPKEPVKIKSTNSKDFTIMWFGVIDNLSMFKRFIPALCQIPEIKIVIVTKCNSNIGMFPENPLIECISWNLDTFTQVLQKVDLCVLTHNGNAFDKAKTNNKMITSITWGVPAIVSDTPEYATTAIKAGVEYAIFSSVDDLVHLVKILKSPDERKKYLEQAQPAIWSEYSPEVITDKFLRICREVREVKK